MNKVELVEFLDVMYNLADLYEDWHGRPQCKICNMLDHTHTPVCRSKNFEKDFAEAEAFILRYYTDRDELLEEAGRII